MGLVIMARAYRPSINSNEMSRLVKVILDPTDQANLDLKLRYGIHLTTEEIKLQLKSPHPSPMKQWILEIIACYLRYLIVQEESWSRHWVAQQQHQKMIEAWLQEGALFRSYRRVLAILNWEHLEQRFEELQAKSVLTPYQHLQSLKISELEFWRRIVTDESALEKIIDAVNAKYHWKAKLDEALVHLEHQLHDTSLPTEVRQHKEDMLEAARMHERLSKPEKMEKYIPDFHEPDKTVHVARMSPTLNQLLLKQVTTRQSQTVKVESIPAPASAFFKVIEVPNEVPKSSGLVHRVINSFLSQEQKQAYSDLITTVKVLKEAESASSAVTLLERIEGFAKSVEEVDVDKETLIRLNDGIVERFNQLVKESTQLMGLDGLRAAIIKLGGIDKEKVDLVESCRSFGL